MGSRCDKIVSRCLLQIVLNFFCAQGTAHALISALGVSVANFSEERWGVVLGVCQASQTTDARERSLRGGASSRSERGPILTLTRARRCLATVKKRTHPYCGRATHTVISALCGGAS